MKTKRFYRITSIILTIMLVMSCICPTLSASASTTSTYIVAGVPELCGLGTNGCGWDPTDTANLMTANEDGTYSKVFTDVAVMDDYQLKVVETDSTGYTNWYGGDGGDDNVTFHVVETCDVTVTFDPATLKLTVTGSGVNILTGIDIDTIRTVGNGDGTWLNGALWDPSDDANLMTEISENIYSITYTDVEEFDNYQVKFAANGSWAINWGGVYAGSDIETTAVFNDNNNITIDVPYKMADVTITLDLSDFDYTTKEGATFTITVVDASTEPTEPITEVIANVNIFGDINLELLSNDTGKYSKTTYLDAGSYQFRINDNGTTKCFGYTFNDTIPNVTYSTNYSSATTLNTTGGNYTFTYDTSTSQLSVTFQAAEKPTEETKIYFEIPTLEELGTIGSYVYCYTYNIYSDTEFNTPSWQSKSTLCKLDSTTGLYYYDTLKIDPLQDDADYAVIFSFKNSNNSCFQTCSVTFGKECIGDTLYLTGNTQQNIDNSTLTEYEAVWKNNSNKYGPLATITPECTIVGQHFPIYQPKEIVIADAIAKWAVTHADTYTAESVQKLCTDVEVEPIDVYEQYETDYADRLADQTNNPNLASLEQVFSLLGLNNSISYIVAGSETLCGVNWDGSAVENKMTKNSYLYVKTFTLVQPAEKLQLKVVENLDDGTQNWIGDESGNNITFNVLTECDVTVIYDTSTKQITVTGDGVEMVTQIHIDTMRIVGNGDGTWLNGISWDPIANENLMTEISSNVYSITYTDIEEFENYQLKFAANGNWNDHWGGTYIGSGIESEAVYFGDNILFDVPYKLADVTITLDLSDFNYATKTGAKFTVTVEDTTPQPTIEPTTIPATTTPGSTEPVYIFFNSAQKSTWTAPYYVYVYDEDTSTEKAYSNSSWPGQQMQYDEATGYYYYKVPAAGCLATDADSNVTSSTFDLAHSANANVIISDTSGQQYPGSGAITKLNLAGSSKIYALNASNSWADTDLVPNNSPTIRIAGNGYDNWLNDVNWDPSDDANLMTQTSPNVYEITYKDIEEFDNYQFKFTANGTWNDNWGGIYEGSGVESVAVYNSNDCITFDVPYTLAYVTLKIDLTNFNYSTNTGAKFTVTVEDATPQIPTEPSTTLPDCTEPIYTEPVPTVPAKNELTVNTTSNFFTSQTATYNNRTNKLVVTYYIQSVKDLLNTQWEMTYDPDILSVSKDINTKETICPSFTTGNALTLNEGVIKFNTYNLSLFDISSEEKIFARVVFDVNDFEALGIYDTTINLNVINLTVSSLDNYTSMTDENEEVKIVYNGQYSDTYGLIVSERVELINSEIPKYIGDIDNSGIIDIHDATKLAKHLAELTTLTEEQLLVADCDGDGIVSIKDVTSIQLYLVDAVNCGNVGQEYQFKP